MKFLLLLLSAAICLVSSEDVRLAFRRAMSKYAEKDQINLSESLEMRTNRFKSFLKFHALVEEVNNDDSLPYEMADNFMSVLTDDERKLHLGLNVSGIPPEDFSDDDDNDDFLLTNSEIPDKRDFSLVISDVKDQSTCGSCWTFGATGALEGEIYFKTGKKKVSLSEQEYMECVNGNNACGGGWPTNCYAYSKKNDRIAPTSAYPYLKPPRDRRKCFVTSNTANALVDNNVKVIGSIYPGRGDAKLLQTASTHIVSVAIHANYRFQGYYNGMYIDDRCQDDVNHAVNVVGYGIDSASGRKYWKLRNSWGQDWGENGYIFMDREKANMCKISTYAHYPRIECRDGNCVAPDPNEGDSSNDEQDEEEEDEEEEGEENFDYDNICFEKRYLGKCNKLRDRAVKQCEVNPEKCVIAKVNGKCYMGLKGTNSGKSYAEISYKCNDKNKVSLGVSSLSADDSCYEKASLSPCQSSREAAFDICKKTVSANECMIVKKGKCYYATNGGSSKGRTLEKAVECEKEEPCNTAGGMVLCSDCNCCKHKHFCSDTNGGH